MTTRTSPAPAGLLRPSLHCLAFAVALGSAGAALAKDVTWEDIANDDKTTGDVLQYGMGTHAQRWSPLKQVNADNVFKLTPAWSYSFGDEKQRGQESQAIVSDGVIYVTASYSRLFALDAKTGKRLWTYNHRLPDDIRPCCDVVNRGAAIYGDKVFFGTLDASVVALNKNTGKVVWKKKFADHGAGYTMTGAPTIVKDGKTGKVLLIHGSSGDEFGVVGRLFARDPDTGEEIWMRPFVEGHMGRLNGKDSTVTGDVKAPSWPDDRNSPTGKVESWSHGGGAPWQSASFDAETNTIIVGAGNPGPWNTWARTAKGGNPHDYDSLYTSGQVGVDPSSGEVKWFYQHTPNDAWDFSGNNELVLFDYKAKDGKIVKATAHADRNGFFYVVDRSNGKLQNAFPFVDNITWASHIDLKTGRPVEREGQRPPLPEPGRSMARRWKYRRRSSAARTGTRWPTARTPACSTCRPTTGRKTTGPRRSAIRRAAPTLAWASGSSACTTTTSAACAPWTRSAARWSGNTRNTCRSGPGCWPPPATWCSPAPATATSRPSTRRAARSCGNSRPAAASSRHRSPGNRTASSTSA